MKSSKRHVFLVSLILREKQLFYSQYGNHGTSLKVIVSNTSILVVQGLTERFWTYKAITGRFLEVYVGLTLWHCTIFDKKIEITSEENLLLLKLTWSFVTSVPYWLRAWQV